MDFGAHYLSEVLGLREYFDEKHIAIDDWVAGSTGEAKELVDDFGVLKATQHRYCHQAQI